MTISETSKTAIHYLLPLLPFSERVYREIWRRRWRTYAKHLRQAPGIETDAGQTLLGALDMLDRHLAQPAIDSIAAIEEQRNKLLADDSPLINGSLDLTGPSDQGLTIADATATSSKGPAAALFMYCLARQFKPTSVLELGTNVGISSAYIATALRENGNDGSLMTLEASAYRLRQAQSTHARLGFNNIQYRQGRFHETLRPVLATIPEIDFAFIDGDHRHEATLAYFEWIHAHAAPGAIFVFDDIRWSAGMYAAWQKLKADSRFSFVADLSIMGVAVLRDS